MPTITHHTDSTELRWCRVCQNIEPAAVTVEFSADEHGPRAIYFCRAHASQHGDYRAVPDIGSHVAVTRMTGTRCLGQVMNIYSEEQAVHVRHELWPDAKDIGVALDQVQVVIGRAAAADMLARGAVLGWTGDAIMEGFGLTDPYELAYLTPGHLSLFDENVRQARATAARAAADTTTDRSAGAVADLLGVTGPAAVGRCHYCGLPLPASGYCPECV